MPPIDDQLSLGSCSADAIVAAMEFKYSGFIGSRLFLYYNERLLTHTVNSDSGSSVENGIHAATTYGVCEESFYPYHVNLFTVEPSKEAYENGLLYRIQGTKKLDRDMNAFKNCLVDGLPFVASIIIYSSFEAHKLPVSGILTLPRGTEDNLGGHAVLICGYDDTLQCWILRNSWGPKWCKKGYCYLPYVYLMDSTLATEFWAVTEVGPGPMPGSGPATKHVFITYPSSDANERWVL